MAVHGPCRALTINGQEPTASPEQGGISKDDTPLRVDRVGETVWCTLDRPPLNLLEPTVIGAIRETFEGLARDPSVRVAVVAASGRAFTAGMDVRVLRDLDGARAKAFITSLHEAIEAVHRAPFPVIAGVHGPCLGAGLELVLACDLGVAETGAWFGLPEVPVSVPAVIEAALFPALIRPGGGDAPERRAHLG